ncbi:MAG: NUDIX domain-containing protein, partial [Nitrososphaerales archaeon]
MSKYHYPAGAVDVIIEKDDKLLLIRRKNEPFKGLLAIPGGFVNEGEKVEDTAVREM